MPATWCLVGLGNPGRRYQKTRHNLGIMVLDCLADQLNALWSQRELYDAASASGGDGLRLLLIKPQTFMNQSGLAVARAVKYRNLRPQNLLVICDDLALPFGVLRLRPRGSDGGHRGLRSVIEHLGTTEIPRLRLGIGAPPPGTDPADYVLEGFNPREKEQLPEILDLAVQGLKLVLTSGIEKAMNEINRTSKKEPR